MSDPYGDFTFESMVERVDGSNEESFGYSGMGESILNVTTILIVSILLVIVYCVCCSDMSWCVSARQAMGMTQMGGATSSFHNGQSFGKVLNFNPNKGILGFKNPLRKSFNAGGNGYPLH